jgi:hypothetical protein
VTFHADSVCIFTGIQIFHRYSSQCQTPPSALGNSQSNRLSQFTHSPLRGIFFDESGLTVADSLETGITRSARQHSPS